jgi:hypothetical protein
MPPTSSDAVNRYFSVKRGKSGKVQNQTWPPSYGAWPCT